MAERRQLPPQIRRVELARRAGSKPVVRYQLTVDTGIVDGKRKQLRRRYRTEKEARAALAEIHGQVASGAYVQPSTLSVEEACADWLRSRHKIRPTAAAGYEYVLQPVRSELGAACRSGSDQTPHRRSDCLAVWRRSGAARRSIAQGVECALLQLHARRALAGAGSACCRRSADEKRCRRLRAGQPFQGDSPTSQRR